MPIPTPPIAAPSQVEILDHINALYSVFNAQLVQILIAAFAIAGIIIPLLIAALQAFNARREKAIFESLIRDTINKEIAIAIAQLDELKQKLAADAKESVQMLETSLAQKIAKGENLALARVHFLQGDSNRSRGQYGSAAEDFLFAMENFAEGKDEANVQTCMENLNGLFPLVLKADYAEYKLDESLASCIKQLKAINQNSRYIRDIEKLQRASDLAKERMPSQPPKKTTP